MLYVRDVIRTGAQWARIIGIADDQAILFDLGANKTSLSAVPLTTLLSSWKSGKAVHETAHGYDRQPNPRASEKQIERAVKLHGVVVGLLAQGAQVFDSAMRGHLVATAAKDYELSPATIHGALYRYWKFGLTLEALFPKFDRCGGRGRERGGEGPLGRKGPDNAPRAPRLTETTLTAFAKGTNRYYRDNPRNSLAEAYRLICDDLLTECVFDPVTRAPVTFIRHGADQITLPTLRQYRHWYGKQDRATADKRKRMPEPKYEARYRPKLSFAGQDNENAGGRYIIDSTPLDLNLISRINATTFLSTATLYLVTDEFTGFITGFSLSLEDASWTAAGLALLNAVDDKVAYCADMGIEIGEEDWPVADLIAMRLLYDKGEAKGHLATQFGLKSSLTIENTASYRGDLKGIGEQRFDLINEALRGRVPGYRVKNSGERGEKDPRLDAILTLPDAIRVIIHTIIFLNKHEIRDFRRSRAMIEDGVPPIPLEMWKWAIRTGRSALARRAYDDLAIALLPMEQATITQFGLSFKGLNYTCETAERENWFENVTSPARLRKRSISFHPWLVDFIYIHDAEGGAAELAALTQHSARYAGLSFAELERLNEIERGKSRNRQIDQVHNHASFSNNIRQIVRMAQQRRTSRLRPRDLVGARDGRHAERELEREDVRDDLTYLAHAHAQHEDFSQPRPTAPKLLPGADLGEGALPRAE
jgi:putative transposase